VRRLECDILILGSGAAGGTLAATLSELTSHSIILVEKGPHYTRTFFNQREWDMTALYADEGTRSTVDGGIVVRGGECVGGGTTVNIALSLDPHADVWEGWRRDHGLQGFSFDASASDLGVAGLNLASCLREVRQRLNVHTPPDSAVNDNNRLFADGCERLGIPTRRFELNMRGCIGCGYCAEGCAYDAKQGTMVTYIADAVSRGVRLIHHFDVRGIDFSERRGRMTATGVHGTVRPTEPGSNPNSLSAGPAQIRAKLVIVACGAIESPALLQRSGHPDPHDVIGRGLVLHTSLPIIGLMDREIVNYRGIAGTFYSDHFRRSQGFYYECLFGHPVYGSALMPGIGADHFDLIRRYTQIAGFGVMLIDSVDRRNRVEWSDARGRAMIHYRLREPDKRRLRMAAEKGVEIMFAAGASEVILPSEQPIGPLPSPRFRSAAEARHCAELQFRPHETTITSAHAQATVKMGEDARTAVIDSRGESHRVRNLVVCDSSSFPTSCGANPMISIMSMARYQGRRIASEASRYGLAVLAAVLLSTGAAEAQTVMVGGVQYESPSLFAPVAVLSVRRGDATEWRVGVAGWTASGAWTRTLSPTRALVAALEVTPINAHSSNKLYVDGEEDRSLAYRNATMLAGAGLRFTPPSRWTTEVRGVVLWEKVADLSKAARDFWRSPFVGVDVSQRYDDVSADDVIRSRFEGVRFAARAQLYAGASSSWGRGTMSLGAGQQVGRLFLRANGTTFHGRSLNTVSAFLTGGSWDASGTTALYGFPYGAFRIERGVLTNGGADVRLWGNTEVGVRAAWLGGPGASHHGGALSVTTLWKGVGVSASLAVPEGDAFRGRWDRALVTGGVTAAVLR
jgi:choline dehydrogenase-like flavoprotein